MQAEKASFETGWNRNFLASLTGGACAGLSVDLLIFPVDTIKTRLQAKEGFISAGGLNKLYAGSGSVALGAAPGSAAFFITYDLSKRFLEPKISQKPLAHMTSACFAETIACLIRVPVEVVKQRTQAGGISSWLTLRNTLKYEGLQGLFRGYGSTVLREIPFSLIQFPLWEWFKKDLREDRKRDLTAFEAAFCGAMAGAVAGAVTTPLDLAKTRIMLHKGSDLTVRAALSEIYQTKGVEALFAGIGLRAFSLAMGGFIFLGIYEKVKCLVEGAV